MTRIKKGNLLEMDVLKSEMVSCARVTVVEMLALERACLAADDFF